MVEVTVDIGNGNEIVAAITKHSVESLGLKHSSAGQALLERHGFLPLPTLSCMNIRSILAAL
jgi:hypothetical protein